MNQDYAKWLAKNFMYQRFNYLKERRERGREAGKQEGGREGGNE